MHILFHPRTLPPIAERTLAFLSVIPVALLNGFFNIGAPAGRAAYIFALFRCSSFSTSASPACVHTPFFPLIQHTLCGGYLALFSSRLITSPIFSTVCLFWHPPPPLGLNHRLFSPSRVLLGRLPYRWTPMISSRTPHSDFFFLSGRPSPRAQNEFPQTVHRDFDETRGKFACPPRIPPFSIIFFPILLFYHLTTYLTGLAKFS